MGYSNIKHNFDLTDREKLILRHVVYNFILTAEPVGSRMLSRRYKIGLSPATIRNTMADLEDLGLLTHPHTSAGRIPTDFGYRIYVDGLMDRESINQELKRKINDKIESVSVEVSEILDAVGDTLSEVTRLLSVITAPDMTTGVLTRLELIRIASDRIMTVIVVNSGSVRTINLEMQSQITDDEIVDASAFINQRLCGLRLSEIPATIRDRLSGGKRNRNLVVRLFLEFPEKIFTCDNRSDTVIGGTKHVLKQPEYQSPDSFQGIIELVEDRDVIVHLLKDRAEGLSVTIGEENQPEQLKDLSVITSKYRIGDNSGTLGIIGPTRMNYSQLISLVDYTSSLVSNRIDSENKQRNER